jgi:phenylacetic acid degradation operon negative regulatory protein
LAQLLHAWRRFPLIGPALPGEPLPALWSDVRAAKLFQQLHAKWNVDAEAEWQKITAPC